MMLTGETKALRREKTCPSTTLSTKIPTWMGLVLNLGPLREKLATNCWDLGAAAFMNSVKNRK